MKTSLITFLAALTFAAGTAFAGIDEGGILGIDEGGNQGIDEGGILGIDEGGTRGIDEGGARGIDEGGTDGACLLKLGNLQLICNGLEGMFRT